MDEGKKENKIQIEKERSKKRDKETAKENAFGLLFLFLVFRRRCRLIQTKRRKENV